MGKTPLEGYSISLKQGPFVAGLQPAFLMGKGTLYAPPINADGGLDAYRPVDVLPPYTSVILQFVAGE